MNVRKQIYKMARQDVKTLVFPEAGFSDRIISAVRIGTAKKLFKAILIGDESAMFLKYSSIANENIEIINSKTSDLKDVFAEEIFKLRQHKGLTIEEAKELSQDPFYFATMLVRDGYADGMVAGVESPSAKTFRPALQLIKGEQPNSLVSSIELFFGFNRALKNKPLFVSDCALVENPTAEGLAEIAKNCVDLWKTLFIEEPKVAFLSYSTNCSAESDSINKMRLATKIFKENMPEVVCEGEMQLDVALKSDIALKKHPESKIKGDANILIVPDINAGSILAKSLQIVAGLNCVGPLSQGLIRPVNDVARSSSVEEIILTSAITAIQAQLD